MWWRSSDSSERSTNVLCSLAGNMPVLKDTNRDIKLSSCAGVYRVE